MAIERYTNSGASTLNGDITSGATSLIVTSAASFPSTGDFRILIDSEILVVTAVSGTTFTVTRAAESTSAAAHTGTTAVKHILTAAAMHAPPVGAMVSLAAAQTIATSTTTAISFDTEDRNTDGYFSSGAPTRLTVPANCGGWHIISAHVDWADPGTGAGERQMRILINGATSRGDQSGGGDADVTGIDDNPDISTCLVYYLTAADYVEVTCFHSQGGNVDVTAQAQIVRIG